MPNDSSTYRYTIPRPELRKWVRTVLTFDTGIDGSSLPVIPPGTAAMVLIGDEDGQLLLFGNDIGADFLHKHHGRFCVVYFFNPFVVCPLFDIPAKDLSDEPMDLSKSKILKEAIGEVRTIKECIRIIDRFLSDQLEAGGNRCDMVRLATEYISTRPDLQVLSDVRRELKISERTLQRLFKCYVGVSPNRFRRLCQFQSAFEQMRMGHFSELTDVAYEQGYADQSHFGRTFRKFTDQSPHEYTVRGLKKD